MHDDLSFLRAIFNQPDDDTLRLVYADWLDEHTDPRGEFLRLEVEHHRADKGDMERQSALSKQLGDLLPKLNADWVTWMRKARRVPAAARLDLAMIENGKGLIEVRGGRRSGEIVLLVEGKPIAFNWDDCQGSVGQYLVFTGHTRGADYARELRAFVEGKVDATRPLANQIAPLLAVFAPGLYCLDYAPSATVEGVDIFTSNGHPSAVHELHNYYPYYRNLVCSQTSESLDEQRVEYFREQIQTGRRPIVLTASAENAWCEFVIDGHHKLAAYTRERVQPTILCIERLQASEISLNEGLEYLPLGHRGVPEYRRMKGDALS